MHHACLVPQSCAQLSMWGCLQARWPPFRLDHLLAVDLFATRSTSPFLFTFKCMWLWARCSWFVVFLAGDAGRCTTIYLSYDAKSSWVLKYTKICWTKDWYAQIGMLCHLSYSQVVDPHVIIIRRASRVRMLLDLINMLSGTIYRLVLLFLSYGVCGGRAVDPASAWRWMSFWQEWSMDLHAPRYNRSSSLPSLIYFHRIGSTPTIQSGFIKCAFIFNVFLTIWKFLLKVCYGEEICLGYYFFFDFEFIFLSHRIAT
jgi:hypothetical protein